MRYQGLSTIKLVVGVGLVSVLGVGCATTRAPGTNPDDMSHAEHMKAARRFEKDAAKHKRRYDPNAERVEVTQWLSDPESHGRHGTVVTDTTVVNPTAEHLDHAKRRREIARQHAAAAGALKAYSDKYCKGVPLKERRAHPLPGQISKVENIPGGVRLHLKHGVKPIALRNRMACHIAQARLEGFVGQKDCPLHLRGLKFRVSAQGRVIELVAKRPNLVTELRRRAKAHR